MDFFESQHWEVRAVGGNLYAARSAGRRTCGGAQNFTQRVLAIGSIDTVQISQMRRRYVSNESFSHTRVL